MTQKSEPGKVIVVDDRSFEVTVYHQTPRSMLLTVIADGRSQWSNEVANWRSWSSGVSQGTFYLWSARQLVVFRGPPLSDPIQVEVDEDILLAFMFDFGWVLVCETSVRLADDQGEIARVEFDEVIELARWEHGQLIIRMLSGSERAITASPGSIVIDAAVG